MARPILNPDGVAANLKNKTKHCNIILTGDNLSTNINKSHVQVVRNDDGTLITIDSAKALPHDGAWVLIVKTKKIKDITAGARLTTTDEISVTVTNPDTNQVSEDTPVDVVYYDEEP